VGFVALAPALRAQRPYWYMNLGAATETEAGHFFFCPGNFCGAWVTALGHSLKVMGPCCPASTLALFLGPGSFGISLHPLVESNQSTEELREALNSRMVGGEDLPPPNQLGNVGGAELLDADRLRNRRSARLGLRLLSQHLELLERQPLQNDSVLIQPKSSGSSHIVLAGATMIPAQ
jgi:hypothetical protein